MNNEKYSYSVTYRHELSNSIILIRSLLSNKYMFAKYITTNSSDLYSTCGKLTQNFQVVCQHCKKDKLTNFKITAIRFK